MALPALGWKVQAWVSCALTLTSSHRCHASSLHEEPGASQSHHGGPTPLAHCQPCSGATLSPQPALPRSSCTCPGKPALPVVRRAVWLGVVVGRCEVNGGRAGHRARWHSVGCGTLSRVGSPWDVPPLCLSAMSPPCPLPCAGPARRWPVEELVGATGLCGIPAPLAAHVPQVRGAAAQPNVSWAGESQGREGAASPWPPKTWVLHLAYPRTPTPRSPRCGCLPAVPARTLGDVGMAAHRRSGVSPQPLPVTRAPRRRPWRCRQACCAPGCGTSPLAAGPGGPPRCWPGPAPAGEGPGWGAAMALKSPCPSLAPLCTCPAPREAAAALAVGARVVMDGWMEGSLGCCPPGSNMVLQGISGELAGQHCTS